MLLCTQVEARVAAQHPTVHSTAPPHPPEIEFLAQNLIGARIEKLSQVYRSIQDMSCAQHTLFFYTVAQDTPPWLAASGVLCGERKVRFLLKVPDSGTSCHIKAA